MPSPAEKVKSEKECRWSEELWRASIRTEAVCMLMPSGNTTCPPLTLPPAFQKWERREQRAVGGGGEGGWCAGATAPHPIPSIVISVVVPNKLCTLCQKIYCLYVYDCGRVELGFVGMWGMFVRGGDGEFGGVCLGMGRLLWICRVVSKSMHYLLRKCLYVLFFVLMSFLVIDEILVNKRQNVQ